MIAYYGGLVEEIIAAEQGGLTEGEEALLELLKKKLRRELSKPPKAGGPGIRRSSREQG